MHNFIFTGSRQAVKLCLFLFLLITVALQKSQAQTYSDNDVKITEEQIESYVANAISLKLFDDEYWHILLLYEKTLTGYKSSVETPAFFLAHDGRTNPKAELVADIRAFFHGENVKFFPARYKWLKQKLNIEDELCCKEWDAEYVAAKQNINPSAVYLVFPAGYMKNPASMFGHTFLLFENENKPKLMGQSVSYGADATNPPGFIYAVKGLFGRYYGTYAVDMYSKEILKYSNMDMRDVWEYKLVLSDEQLDMLLRHTMEVALTATRYYYISKNCTYYLFALLESAYTDENLLKELGNVAEPLKAVKIMYQKGLTEEPLYRPSLNTLINSERMLAGNKNADSVKKYCYGKLSISQLMAIVTTDDEKTNALRLASDYLKYLLSNSKITQDQYKQRVLPVFNALSKIKNKSVSELISSDYPHKSHDSRKIALSTGLDGNKIFEQTYFHFVNHSLIDCDTGLNKNTQLTFLSGSISIYPDGSNDNNRKLRLDAFDFANILSLPVSDSYFCSKAVNVIAGIEQNQKDAEESSLALRLKLFGGLSCKAGNPNQLYFLTGLDLYGNPFYDYYSDVFAGVQTGVLTGAGVWKQHVNCLVEQGIFKNNGCTGCNGIIGKSELVNMNRLRLNLSVEERLALSRNTAVSALYSYYGDYKKYNHKFCLTGHINF